MSVAVKAAKSFGDYVGSRKIVKGKLPNAQEK